METSEPAIYLNNLGPFPGKTTIETEQIEITSLTKPDPGWHVVDNSGHYHTYDKDWKTPTLHRIAVPTIDEDDIIYKVVCRICNEEVSPGTISSGIFREFTPGRTTVTLKVAVDGLETARYLSQVNTLSFQTSTMFGIASFAHMSLRNGTAWFELIATHFGMRERLPGRSIECHGF